MARMNFATCFALGAVLFATAACSTNPATGASMFSFMSEEAEFDLGHKVAGEEIEKYGLYAEKPQLTTYYTKMAQKAVSVSERPDKPFDFLLLDSPMFNAWATPGYVAVYRGLLPMMNSEAEFATVLAHEVGHVAAQHAVRAHSTATFTQIGVFGLALTTALATGDAQITQSVTDLSSSVASVGLSSFSRGYEREADSLALRYLARMGYDPKQAYNTFSQFERMRYVQAKELDLLFGISPQPSDSYNILSSHPKPSERMNNIAQEVGKPATSAALAPESQQIGRSAYLQQIDGTTFGPRAEVGVATRKALYMPKQRVKFSLPDGFYFQPLNEGSGWRGVNADTNMTMTVTRLNLTDRRYVPEGVLRAKFPEFRGVKMVDLGSHMAATASGMLEVDKNVFTGKGRYVGYQRAYVINAIPKSGPDNSEAEQQDGHTFYLILFTYGADAVRYGAMKSARQQGKGPEAATLEVSTFDHEGFDSKALEIAKSFKPLTYRQARRISPLRVDVVTVKAGDTVQSLSRRMALGALRQEWFVALNGIENNAQLKAGHKVKILVDPN